MTDMYERDREALFSDTMGSGMAGMDDMERIDEDAAIGDDPPMIDDAGGRMDGVDELDDELSITMDGPTGRDPDDLYDML